MEAFVAVAAAGAWIMVRTMGTRDVEEEEEEAEEAIAAADTIAVVAMRHTEANTSSNNILRLQRTSIRECFLGACRRRRIWLCNRVSCPLHHLEWRSSLVVSRVIRHRRILMGVLRHRRSIRGMRTVTEHMAGVDKAEEGVDTEVEGAVNGLLRKVRAGDISVVDLI